MTVTMIFYESFSVLALHIYIFLCWYFHVFAVTTEMFSCYFLFLFNEAHSMRDIFPSAFSSLLTLLLTLLWAVKCCSCPFLFHDWANKRQVFAAHALDMESNRDRCFWFFFKFKVFVSVSVILQIQYFSILSAEAATVFHTSSKERY